MPPEPKGAGPAARADLLIQISTPRRPERRVCSSCARA